MMGRGAVVAPCARRPSPRRATSACGVRTSGSEPTMPPKPLSTRTACLSVVAALTALGALACGKIAPDPGSIPDAGPPLASPSSLVPTDAGPRPIVWGIVGVGQSLAIGTRRGAEPYEPVVKSAGEGHFMLRNLTGGTADSVPFAWARPASEWQLSPLSEPLRERGTGVHAWPENVASQSPHTPFAAEIDRLSSGTIRTAHVVVGQDGQPISALAKGGTQPSYAAALAEATRLRELLAARGMELRFAAVLLTHGESDDTNPSYADDIVKLQADYERDLDAVTGHADRVPMFLTHPSAGYAGRSGDGYNGAIFAMSRAACEHPDRVRLVGSKTHLEYLEDDFHLTATGTAELGRLYARHVFPWIARGTFVEPLAPVRVERSGTRVTVVMNRPLVDDPRLFGDTHAPGPWENALGLEVTAEDGTPIAVESTEIVGERVVLSCVSVPAFVSHAIYADGPSPALRRVRLRDRDGEWLVQFREPVPGD